MATLNFKIKHIDDEPTFVFTYKRSSREKMRFVLTDPMDARPNQWEKFVTAVQNGEQGGIDFNRCAGEVTAGCKGNVVEFDIAVGGSGGNGWLKFRLPGEKCVGALATAWKARCDLEYTKTA